MRSVSLLLMLCSATVAHAQTRMAVVGMGDCSDQDLVRNIRLVSERLAAQPGIQIAGPDQLENRLGSEPRRSIEEIQRQIDSAQQLFYQAQYHTALERLDIALKEIDRLPPGGARWHLSVGAHLLEGLLRARVRNGRDDAEAAFRYVLRLDPKHQLDRDYFSPSTIKEFDRVRAKLAKEPRQTLTVNSKPVGIAVYVDGREMGRTPFELKLPVGDYRVQIGKEKRFSMPRTVGLKAPAEVFVDFGFEGAIASRQPPCFDNAESEAERLKHGTSFGSLIGIDQVVMLRHERRDIGPGWLAATLVGVVDGRKIREGGLELRNDAVDGEALGELARFVATGEKTPKVRVIATPAIAVVDRSRPIPAGSAGSPQPPAGAAPVVMPASAGAPAADPTPATSAASSAGGTGSGAWMRPTGYGLLGGAVLFAGGGLAVQLRGSAAQKEFDALNEGGLTKDEASAARAALDTAESSRTLSLVGYGVGAAALVGGVTLLLLAPDSVEQAPTVTVAPSLIPNAPGAVMTGVF